MTVERVCRRCGGSGEIWPRDVRLTSAEAEARVRACDDCGGSGSPDRPPPAHLDGDHLYEASREAR